MEKIGYLHIYPRQRLLTFVASGSNYSTSVDYYVNTVYRGGAELTSASSIVNVGVDGDYFYSDKTIYIDDTSGFIVAEYILFFSTKTNIATLGTSTPMTYEGLISSDVTSSFELGDRDQDGNALEGKTRVSLKNQHGFFDEIIEQLTWSNAKMKTWVIRDDVTYKLFDGFISGQTFNAQLVSFSGKNFLDKLRTSVPLDLFSTGIEQIDEKYKRRIYGQVDNLNTTSLDPILNGYTVSGLFSGTAGTQIITVSGGSASTEVLQGDQLTVNEQTYYVESVVNGSTVNIAEEISATFANKSGEVLPERPRSSKNRIHQIAGHELYEKSTTVASNSTSFSRLTVVDSTNIFTGDTIYINSVKAIVKRVSIDNFITLESQIGFLFTIGMSVIKPPIQAIRFNSVEFDLDDATLTNSSESYITLNELAEFNGTKQRKLTGSFVFTNGSMNVSGPVKESLRSGDWVRPDTTSIWYQVNARDVENTMIRLTSIFSGSTSTYQVKAKYVEYVGDTDGIQVDCLGKKDELGAWIKTGAQTVRDLVTEHGLSVNESSFTTAGIDNNMLISMMLPETRDATAGTTRDAIGKINKSIFGNLYPNNDLEISYSILTQDKTEQAAITDHDILSNTQSIRDTNILSRVDVRYRFQDKDPYTKEPTSIVSSQSNTDTEYLTGNSRRTEINVYLYSTNDADVIAQRFLFMREFKESLTTVKTKDFLTKAINDLIYYKFDRMSKGYSEYRLGKVMATSKGAFGTILKLDDIGSTLTRVGVITDIDLDYSSATDIQKDFIGFITDADEMINTDGESYKNNLIG